MVWCIRALVVRMCFLVITGVPRTSEKMYVGNITNIYPRHILRHYLCPTPSSPVVTVVVLVVFVLHSPFVSETRNI